MGEGRPTYLMRAILDLSLDNGGEMDELHNYFSKGLELPEEMMEESRRNWKKVSVFVQVWDGGCQEIGLQRSSSSTSS